MSLCLWGLNPYSGLIRWLLVTHKSWLGAACWPSSKAHVICPGFVWKLGRTPNSQSRGNDFPPPGWQFCFPCHAALFVNWSEQKKSQPFSAHAEVSPWIHRAQLLHCLQMFSLFFLSSRILGFTPSTVQPFFLGDCFDIKLKTSPAPQWCCRRGETGGAGGISWANEARGIWHLWAGCDRAPGGAERPLSGEGQGRRNVLLLDVAGF